MYRPFIGSMVLIILLLPRFVWSSPVSEVIQQLESEKSPEKRSKLLERLRSMKPDSPADIDLLLKEAKRPGGAPTLGILRRIEAPSAPDIQDKILSLVDIDDETEDLQVLSAVLEVNTRARIPGARDRILARLKREPKSKYQRKEDLHFLWRDGGTRQKELARIRLLASSLAKFGDADSMAFLFSLDEVMAAGSPSPILAPYGVLALDFAIENYPNETGMRRSGMLDVISAATYAEALPRLRKLLSAADPRVRQVAVDTLLRANAPDIDSILERMKEDSDEKVRTFSKTSALRRNPAQNSAALMESIFGKGPIDQLTALRILATDPIPGTEEDLERFIREDENKRPHSPGHRYYAAQAIWKLTGRKIEYSRGAATNQYYPWENPTRR
jgi:hypothetical protein